MSELSTRADICLVYLQVTFRYTGEMSNPNASPRSVLMKKLGGLTKIGEKNI